MKKGTKSDKRATTNKVSFDSPRVAAAQAIATRTPEPDFRRTFVPLVRLTRSTLTNSSGQPLNKAAKEKLYAKAARHLELSHDIEELIDLVDKMGVEALDRITSLCGYSHLEDLACTVLDNMAKRYGKGRKRWSREKLLLEIRSMMPERPPTLVEEYYVRAVRLYAGPVERAAWRAMAELPLMLAAAGISDVETVQLVAMVPRGADMDLIDIVSEKGDPDKEPIQSGHLAALPLESWSDLVAYYGDTVPVRFSDTTFTIDELRDTVMDEWRLYELAQELFSEDKDDSELASVEN